jgi:hypothetical protein
MPETVANVPTPNKPRTGLSGADAVRFFGSPPLFKREDLAQYQAIRDHITAAVAPSDFLEEIWVNDFANLLWETQRLRRLKAALIEATAHEGVKKVMRPFCMQYGLGYSAEELARDWVSGDKTAARKVKGNLRKAGLTMDAVMATTLALQLDSVERIERLIASSEARRIAILREVDRHRSVLATAMQQAAQQVEDAEFEEIPSQQTEGEAA